MRQRTEGPGVIVLGSDFKALGVVRSLGRRGVPCIVVDNVPRSAWFSRYVVKKVKWSGSLGEAALLKYLLEMGEEHHLDGWLLFPTQDEVVELVARHTELLLPRYRLVTQPWEILQWANDKRLTYQLACEANVAVPGTWQPKDERELERLPLNYPVIIKPASSIHLQYALRLKALPAKNGEELLAQYRRAVSVVNPHEILVQEEIPGDGQTQSSFAAYCKDGEVLFSMTARRIRQYPIDYGLGSSFVEAVEIPELVKPSVLLIRQMRLSGMVELEFKYDQRSREHKLLDINTRPWGWHTLCIACGLDFPLIQYKDLLGEPLEPVQPAYGYRWVRLLTDLPAGLQEARAHIHTLWSYLRSLHAPLVFSVFDWADPLPAVGDLAIACSRLLRGFKGEHSR